MTDWRRMEPQPEMMILADNYLAFVKTHDEDPVGVCFLPKDGSVGNDVVDGKRYRLTLVVEEESMNMQEALEQLTIKARLQGMASTRVPNDLGNLEKGPTDADIAAAEAAVLALYEKQKAVADELAEALEAIAPLASCGWDGDCCSGAECKDDPDCAAATGKVRAALAHYRELEGKHEG